MISVVIVGRNDNYGGDFEDRLFATTHHNLAELKKQGVDVELIFVEWNPLSDRRLLSESITADFEEARCFVVDGTVHRLFNENKYLPLLEYHAENIGALRADGSWLLLTNPDNFFGKAIIDFLADGAFDPGVLYRAGWIDVESDADVDRPDLIDQYTSDTPPYGHAAGDFILCSKALFDRVGGFREDLAFTTFHKDAIFCHDAFELTGQASKIGTTYHLRHERDEIHRRRLKYDWRKTDRTRQSSYGLASGIATKLGDRITLLELPPELLLAAHSRRPGSARVPIAYRMPTRSEEFLKLVARKAKRQANRLKGAGKRLSGRARRNARQVSGDLRRAAKQEARRFRRNLKKRMRALKRQSRKAKRRNANNE
ncbi:MAG: hypothetical protein GY798_09355 [Hyphomicrobiales bacterium]|nr:hypothetical protein [Hyphomicrobiales bacterium]